MKEKKTLGFNLKRLRQVKGLTQTDLAEKVGLTSDTISKLELGKQENIGFKYLVLIHRELDVSIEELFMEDPATKFIKLVLSDQNVQSLERILAMVTRKSAKKEE